jgi:hypothetical protein
MSKHGLEGVPVVWLICANLHNLLCICIQMAPTGTVFIFRVIRTLQNMFWKVFLLFGDLG